MLWAGVHPARSDGILNQAPPSATCILLDVEGTTTSISFVYDVLFPYARRRISPFLQQHGHEPSVQEILAALRAQHAEDVRSGLLPPASQHGQQSYESETHYACWLMDRDSKSTPLKALQGMIWEEGYRGRQLKSHVFPDVPEAFKRWKQHGRTIAIFSSGSVLAQKLLFAHTEFGDLAPYVDAYFDTAVGAKREPASYRAIARVLQCRPADMIFVSDITEELDAASGVGITALLCIRPGNRPQAGARYQTIHNLQQIA